MGRGAAKRRARELLNASQLVSEQRYDLNDSEAVSSDENKRRRKCNARNPTVGGGEAALPGEPLVRVKAEAKGATATPLRGKHAQAY